MKNYPILTFIICLVLLTSCRKDESLNNQGSSPIYFSLGFYCLDSAGFNLYPTLDTSVYNPIEISRPHYVVNSIGVKSQVGLGFHRPDPNVGTNPYNGIIFNIAYAPKEVLGEAEKDSSNSLEYILHYSNPEIQNQYKADTIRIYNPRFNSSYPGETIVLNGDTVYTTNLNTPFVTLQIHPQTL